MVRKKKTLIITGGYTDPIFAKEFMDKEKFDFIIAADSGLEILYKLKRNPNIIVGDFDSVNPQILSYYKENNNYNENNIYKEIEICTFLAEKDYTDTEAAIHTAIEHGSTEIALLGATGNRIDHMISNIHLLLILLKKNIKAYIIDNYNKCYLAENNITLQKDKIFGKYISLIPVTQEVVDVTLLGFKYPLTKHKLKKEESLGISNEIIDEKATISFTAGILLIIEAQDE